MNKLAQKHLEIIELAKTHAKRSYRDKLTSMAAVLLTKKGNMYTGINVKYKKIWKCICAERVAIAKAIEAGETDFDTIVTVKYFPETDTFTVMNMCGECRQIAICHAPFNIISLDKKTTKVEPIEKILPYAYVS